MKRFISFLLSLILVISMIPFGSMTAFAEETGPALSISTDYRVQDGQIDVTVTMGAFENLGSLGFKLLYPADKVSINGTPTWGANLPGLATNELGASWIDANGGGISVVEHDILKVTFDILEDATGTIGFSIGNYVASNRFGDEYDTNPSDKASANVTIVTILNGDIFLSGSVAEPVKNQSDNSNLSAAGVDVSVSWSPALVDGKFAAGTPYTATITVTAAENYLFGPNAEVKLAGYTFEKQEDGSIQATKSFGATDFAEITSITITNSDEIDVPTAAPGAETFAVLPLTATGNYDDGSTGVDITPSWSVDGVLPAGVTLDGDSLQVSNSASAGSVQVKAAVGGVEKTMTITIQKDSPVLTVLNISGGVASISVPAKADSPYHDDHAFAAEGFDQYGKNIALGTVEWSISPAYPGLSITDAKLSITNEAAGGTATVKAVTGGMEKSVDVQVDRDPSKPAVVAVGGGVDSISVPTAAEGGRKDSEAFTATVKDQFDVEMAAAVIEWSIESAPEGVSINRTTGVLTVTKEAAAGNITVKATCGGKFGTKSVSITKAASSATTVKIYQGDDDVTASTQTMVIPKTGTNTASYTAQVLDQFDSKMSAEPTWAIAPAGQGVTVSGGTVSVAAGAKADSYTLTASYAGKEGALTITVSNKKDATVTLADSEITYGETYTPAPEADVAGGSWTYSYIGIDGTDYGPSSTAPTQAGKYTVTAVYESDTHYGSENASLTIKQKELTISNVSADDRAYDGTFVVTLTGGELVGNLDGADVGFTLGTGTIEKKNAGDGKAVTTAITLTGAKKDNYTLKQPTDITVNISQKALQVTYTGSTLTKVYDGTKNYAGEVSLTLDGLVDSEASGTLKAAGGVYNSPNVAEAAELTSLGSLTATGFSLSNYSYTLPKPAAEITAKPVDVTVGGDASPFSYKPSGPVLSGSYTNISGQMKTDVTFEKTGDNGKTWPYVDSYTLTATIADSNYTANAISSKYVIKKADLSIIAAVTKQVRYNDTELKTLTPADFGIEIPGEWQVSPVGTQEIVQTFTNTNGVLGYQLKPGLSASDKGKTAVYNLTFIPEDSDAYRPNYNNGASVLTIEVIEKEPITDITVSLPGIAYGETLSDPVGKTAQTGGSWSYIYKGTLSDGANTVYAASSVKPTQPGSYTVTATYESETHKGSGSASFTIGKKQLSFTGLTVEDKTYNGTAKATVTGTMAYLGIINGDAIDPPAAITGAVFTFADPEVGNGKAVRMSGYTNTLSGADAWKYNSPAALTLSGNIIKANAPVAIGDDAKRLAVDTIENKYASYSAGITGVYADAPAVQAALAEEAKKTIPSIGSNIAYYDIQLQILEGSAWSDKDDESVTILFPYPSGTSKSTTFVVVHMKDDGTLGTPAVTKNSYGVFVTVDSTSPFAIAWRVRGSSLNGSDDSSEDSNYDFWSTVEKNIKKADSGDVIRVDAGEYDKMPWTVMKALRDNKVTLVINWNGGKTITIPAGQALADEAGRIYYPLSYLEQKYQIVSASAPDKMNPGTGVFAELIACAPAENKDTVITPAEQGIDEAQAKLETTPITPITETSSAQNVSAASGGHVGVFAAIFAALAALVAGGWVFWKKKQKEM
ncbi:MAG: YDG domain-containing protein [Oscillospiraceae bacterium]